MTFASGAFSVIVQLHRLIDLRHYFTATQLILFLLAGIFFVLPCIESYQKVDLRTITLGVPPQEVTLRLPILVVLEKVPSEGS